MDNFHQIINEACEKGIVSETLFDEMGVVKDCDSTGNIVLREAEISQECRQRTKCLTHAEQGRASRSSDEASRINSAEGRQPCGAR